MRNARSQSSVVRLWMRPLGDEHAGVADQHVEPAEALDGAGDDRLDLVEVADVGEHRLDAPRASGEAATVASSDGVAHVAQHEVGVGLAGEVRAREGGAERAAGSGDDDDPSASYEQVPPVDVEDGAGDERRGVRREELVGAGQVGGRAPALLRGVAEDRRRQLGVVLPRRRPAASRTSPGATTFTVMPAGARSRARPLASPTSPAFDAL